MKKPNFFIVGGARCGTTSLWQLLKAQPEVFMPDDEMFKEPAFFSYVGQRRSYEQYLQLFQNANNKHLWVGEASTAYMTDPQSAQRIFEYNKDAKIIIMLRNPVYRAYSLYNWMVQDGYEYAESFSKALALEDVRANKTIPNYFEPEYYHNYLYFHSGLFYQQVKRFIDLFGDDVLIIKFEDYVYNFQVEYAKICDFLKIKPAYHTVLYTNSSRKVKYPVLQFLLRKFTNFLIENRDEAKRLQNEKSVFKSYLMDQFYYDLDKINKVVDMNFIKRYKLEQHFSGIIKLLYDQKTIPHKCTKDDRDVLLRLGWLSKDVRPMNNRISIELKERYKENILELNKYSGLDFTTWL